MTFWKIGTATAPVEASVAALAEEQIAATMRLTATDGQPFAGLRWGIVQREWPLRLGSATVTGLPAGEYGVEVTASDGRSWRGRATVIPGATNRLTL